MNDVKILAKELREILTGVRKIIPKMPSEFRFMRIDIGKQLEVLCTDGTAFLSYRKSLSERPKNSRSYFVSFDALCDFGRKLPARQEISITVHEGYLTFNTDGRVFDAHPPKKATPFPQPSRVGGVAQQVSKPDREAILRALTCASTDQTRHVLQGAYLDPGDGFQQVVGTDGRCLYHETLTDLEIPQPFILPASALLNWKGFSGQWNLKLDQKKEAPVLIQLTAGPWTWTTPATEGNYPRWQQVLPDRQKLKTKVILGESDLPILKGLTGEAIGIICTDGNVTLVSQEKGSGKWTSHPTRTSVMSGPDCRIFVNPMFVLRALNAGLNQVSIGDEIDPCLFQGKDRELVVMPMRVSGFPESSSPPKEKPKPMNPPQPKPMRTNTAPPPNNTPSQAALESLRTLRGQLRESIGLVDTAMRQFKEAEANQRATQKDLKTIRGSLKSLKSVAFPS